MTENPVLLERLFGKPALSEVDDVLLRKMIRDYPYFAHARWAWAAKTAAGTEGPGALHQASAFTYHSLRLEAYLARHRNGKAASGTSPAPGESPDSAGSSNSLPEARSGGTVTVPAVETAGNPITEDAAVDASPGSATETPSDTFPESGAGSGAAAQDDARPRYAGNGEPQDPETPVPLIQPLFAEDYFAYTGAKLPENPDNDKKPTMEQLHSFTDWLRTMKRPKGSRDPDIDPSQDLGPSEEERDLAAVTQSADVSLRTDSEVYTEAMAEVRISAGQPEKAVAIYEKLSLHYPEKSSYFAQKIADLKSK